MLTRKAPVNFLIRVAEALDALFMSVPCAKDLFEQHNGEQHIDRYCKHANVNVQLAFNSLQNRMTDEIFSLQY